MAISDRFLNGFEAFGLILFVLASVCGVSGGSTASAQEKERGNGRAAALSEVQVEEKWKEHVRDSVLNGIKPLSERDVRQFTKYKIISGRHYSQQLCQNFPQIIKKLNYTQGELDAIAQVLRHEDDLTYRMPSEVQVRPEDARLIIETVLNQKILLYKEYLLVRRKRESLLMDLFAKIDREKSSDEKWRILVQSFPSLKGEKIDEKYVISYIKSEINSSNSLAISMLRSFPDFFVKANYTSYDKHSIALTWGYEGGLAQGYLGDMDNLPQPETIKSILLIVTKRKFESLAEFESFMWKNTENADLKKNGTAQPHNDASTQRSK